MNSIPHPDQVFVPKPANAKKPAKQIIPHVEQSDRLFAVSKAIANMPTGQGALFAALFMGRLSGLSMYKHAISVRQLIEMAEGLEKEVKL